MSFLSRIQKLASETAIYGISTIVGRLVNFLLVPLYVNFFPPDRYGIVVLVYTSFLILNHVYQHGMESAYLKFASGSEERGRLGNVFSTATWSLLLVSLALSGAMLALRDPLSHLIQIGPAWTYLWYYAAAILSLDALAIVPFAELRLQNRPLYFAALKLSNIAINVGLNIGLIIGMGMGIEAIFISNVVASASTFLLVLPLYARLLTPSFDGGLWKQLMAFGLPFLPSGISYAFVDRVNLFFLGSMDGSRVLELYRNAIPPGTIAEGGLRAGEVLSQYVTGIFGAVWKLGVFMMLVAQMFRFAWQPFFLQHAGDEDAKPLFARIFTLYTAASTGVLLAVSFLVDELVALPLMGDRRLIPEAYWFALYLVPVALLAYFFQGWYYNFMAGAYIEKKTKYFVVCTFAGAVVALIVNITLIPVFGMLAAAWATTVAYAVMALSLLFIVQRFYPVPYSWSAILRIGLLGGGLFFLWYTYAGLQIWWIECGLLIGYLLGLFVLRVLPIGTVRRLIQARRG